MTVFYEGQQVQYTGPDAAGARGHIMAVAGSDSMHVKWASGPFAGDITLTDIYDLSTVASASTIEHEDPMHLTAVRKIYDMDGDEGVLNFLASKKYLSSWEKIAEDVLAYAEDRIRTDASMDLVEEQLTAAERDQVVRTGALVLLRDAFSTEQE